MRLATYAALTAALSLALAKAVAWWLSGSVSLLAGLHQSDEVFKSVCRHDVQWLRVEILPRSNLVKGTGIALYSYAQR